MRLTNKLIYCLFLKDATASVKMNNKFYFNKKKIYKVNFKLQYYDTIFDIIYCSLKSSRTPKRYSVELKSHPEPLSGSTVENWIMCKKPDWVFTVIFHYHSYGKDKLKARE